MDRQQYTVRADAFYVRHDTGVWLRNTEGSLSMTGAGAYDLVHSLFSQFDRGLTVEEICADLPSGTVGAIRRLVGILARSGFIRAVTHGPEEVPGWAQELYPEHLAYLDYHADRPVARLLRVRSRTVAVLGSGVALRSVVGALGDFGVAGLFVVTTDADAAALMDVVAAATARDPGLRWRTRAAGHALDLRAAGELPEIGTANQVMLAMDWGDPGELGEVQRLLQARGRAVGVVGRCGDFVVGMPPSAPPGADGTACWECIYRCIAAHAAGESGGLEPATGPATIAALHVVQHTFALLADVEPDRGGAVAVVEPLVPTVRMHTPRRHPCCRQHAPLPRPLDRPVAVPANAGAPAPGATRAGMDLVRPDIPASGDPAEIVSAQDRIVAVTTAWIDRLAGPLLALGEGKADQLPLASSDCQVADPDSTADRPLTRLFTCHAISPREARNQVVLLALEWLAGHTARRVGAGLERYAFGAGWSPAEACYRAWRAAALAQPAEPLDWRRSSGGAADDGAGDLRGFLVRTLTGRGRPWRAVAVDPQPSGFVRAFVCTGEGVVTAGAGIDRRHAVDDALLCAAAGAVAEGAAAAHLAPPRPTWTAAAATVSGAGVLDASCLVPFAAGEACVMAVPVGGGGR
jgi:hypothetical protein